MDTWQGHWCRLVGYRPKKSLCRFTSGEIRERLSARQVCRVAEKVRCLSWFTLKRANLGDSQADFWVFVLQGFKSAAPDFVVIPTSELRHRMAEIHGSEKGTLQSYLCTTESNLCWDVRAPRHEQLLGQIANNVYKDANRDFTRYLNMNGWNVVAKKLNR
jgi:hypothetical protein